MSMVTRQYLEMAQIAAGERDRLLAEHLPEVRFIAKRIHDRLPPHVALEDLVHAGVLGLMDAFGKYDPERKVQFKSYAKFRIRGAILDSLRAMDWSPRELRQKARRLELAERKLRHDLGRPATETELAAELGVSLKEYQDLLSDLRGLDLGSLEGGDDAQEGHAPPETPAAGADAYQACFQSELKRLLAGAIGELPEKEQQVLSLYYFEELTMKEVGLALGVSESRVCQIHSGAMVRLRGRLREALAARPRGSAAPPASDPGLDPGILAAWETP